jgi:hypothetical protein
LFLFKRKFAMEEQQILKRQRLLRKKLREVCWFVVQIPPHACWYSVRTASIAFETTYVADGGLSHPCPRCALAVRRGLVRYRLKHWRRCARRAKSSMMNSWQKFPMRTSSRQRYGPLYRFYSWLVTLPLSRARARFHNQRDWGYLYPFPGYVVFRTYEYIISTQAPSFGRL